MIAARNTTHRTIRGIVAAAALAGAALTGCASDMAASPAASPEPDLRSAVTMPVEQVFADAIENICFAGLTRGLLPTALAGLNGFEETLSASPSLRSEPGDRLYSAADYSAPVLLSLKDGEARCDVIAVTGDPVSLRSAAEEVVSRFYQDPPEGIGDHAAATDRAPHRGFALRFTLLYGTAIDKAGNSVTGTDDAEINQIVVTE